MPAKKILEIDGAKFSTLEEFAQIFSAAVLKEHDWRGNLDAFNDILRGGFGTPPDGFVLVWRNSAISRVRLGYPETIRQLKARLETCHPSNLEIVRNDLERAEAGQGTTVFDWLIEIIRDHGPGGQQSEDGVELQLK